MAFGETIEQVGEFAEQALEIMRAKDIPPAPLNYSVWYSYVSDGDPMLKSAVNQLLENDNDVSADTTAELYDRFLNQADNSQLVEETAEKMGAELKDVSGYIGDAKSDFSGFHAAVKAGLKDFTNAKDIYAIQTTMQNLVVEARNVQACNQDLQDKLIRSSVEIEKLQSNLQSAQKESLTDGLTGISNRKMFDTMLTRSIEKSTKDASTFCLVMCDIDFFKKFNDTYGHQIGDHVLKLVANVLHENVKGSDLAARYGGEEFVIILPNTEINAAYSLVEKIRKTIASRTVRSRQRKIDYGTVTLSLGIAQYSTGDDSETLIGRADAALYTAKNTGRNRTVLESEVESAKA